MHMFMATSRFLNLPIHVIYPAVNGTTNYNFKTMNTLIRPPFADPEQGTIYLMWTSLSLPREQPTSSNPWKANHIVPLVANVTRGSIQKMPYLLNWNSSKRDNSQNPITTKNMFQNLPHEIINVEENQSTESTIQMNSTIID
jgi:hypothetical protein